MPRDILELPAPPADRRLSYGPNALHFGDLRMPAGAGPHPAIIYIHGGFWRAKYGLEHAGHFCEALRSAGVATWNIEYRRVGQDGGGWPGTLDDVLRAARFIERIARSHPIDLERVLVAGHSAGGQLALWTAAQNAIDLRAAVSLGGVVDLRRAFELRLGDGAVEQFLGAAPDEAPERYTATSPLELLPFRTPQLLIHGTRDDVVPIELADRFDAASNNCKILRLEGGDHFDAIDPWTRCYVPFECGAGWQPAADCQSACPGMHTSFGAFSSRVVWLRLCCSAGQVGNPGWQPAWCAVAGRRGGRFAIGRRFPTRPTTLTRAALRLTLANMAVIRNTSKFAAAALACTLALAAAGKKAKTPMLKDQYAEVNGVRLHYVTAGKGPLIIFLHGFPEFWYEWKHQLEDFGKDHLAVAPDMRGYNLSAKPVEVDQYQMKYLVEDVRALAEHLGHKKFVLVGHDWGGAVAWAFAISHPECLEKLVIVNAPHPGVFMRELRDNPDQQKASQYMLMFRGEKAEETLSANNYGVLVGAVLGPGLKTGAFTEDDKKAYIEAWSKPGALTGGLNYYRAAKVGPPAPATSSGEGAAASGNFGLDMSQLMVKVPTLVIWGEKDTALLTGNLEGLDKFVPELTIKRIAEGSHWVIHEKPSEVDGFIREFIGR